MVNPPSYFILPLFHWILIFQFFDSLLEIYCHVHSMDCTSVIQLHLMLYFSWWLSTASLFGTSTRQKQMFACLLKKMFMCFTPNSSLGDCWSFLSVPHHEYLQVNGHQETLAILITNRKTLLFYKLLLYCLQ